MLNLDENLPAIPRLATKAEVHALYIHFVGVNNRLIMNLFGDAEEWQVIWVDPITTRN